MKLSFKRIIIAALIIAVILTAGIVLINKSNSKENTVTPEETETVSSEVVSKEEQPSLEVKQPSSPLGLYVKENKVLKKHDTIKFQWPASDSDSLWKTDTWTVPGQSHLIHDLACFVFIPSAENEVSIKKYDPDWLNIWNKYYGKEQKIGYEFNVVLKSGETKHLTVKQTSDTMKLGEYFEIYLYDDVYHTGDKFYSHTKQSEYNSRDTVYNNSIKITLCNKCYDIERIELTGFVYTSDADFDQNGSYIGADKVCCTILPE